VVEHVSIGNVELRLFNPEPTHTVSYNGTLGMQMEDHPVLSYQLRPSARLVLFSDGISRRLEIPRELLGRAPIEVATYLFANFRRDYDDATVLVLG
jgi:hypothetical protein